MGAGRRQHPGGLPGWVIVYTSFLGKKMEWEVPEVRTGSYEIDTRSCGSCLAPSFKLEDAETSSPRLSLQIHA